MTREPFFCTGASSGRKKEVFPHRAEIPPGISGFEIALFGGIWGILAAQRKLSGSEQETVLEAGKGTFCEKFQLLTHKS